jgi:hypothetical protein
LWRLVPASGKAAQPKLGPASGGYLHQTSHPSARTGALWLKISCSAIFNPESSMSKKIRVEADICAPKPIPPKGYTTKTGHGQKISLERGSHTRSKKNPGKRPQQG